MRRRKAMADGRRRARARRRHAVRRRARTERRERDKAVSASYGHAAHQACGRKNRYPSEGVAQTRAIAYEVLRGQELRVYRCPYCGGWHLTSHGV